MIKLKPSLRKLYGCHHDLVDSHGISVSQIITNMLFVAITTQSFLHSRLTTVVVTRITRRVPHVEEELLPFRNTIVHPRAFSFSHCGVCF